MNYQEILDLCARGAVEVRGDSRKVEKGDIYVAIPGEKDDGARYIPEAINRGATYIVCENPPDRDEGEVRYARHSRPRVALAELAAARFGAAKNRAKIIGVTGTNGKTTTVYLLENLFSALGYKTGALGTVSYRWGDKAIPAPLTTPDPLTLHQTLAAMSADGVEYVFMEVSSHALTQDRVRGVNFSGALFTNLTQDHLDFHKDMEDYFRAKARLFFDCSREDKKIVVNGDDAWGRRLLELLPDAWSFGLTSNFSPNVSLRGTVLSRGVDGHRVRAASESCEYEFSTPLVGEFNVLNILGAQAMALRLGIEPEQLRALEKFSGVRGRLERVANPKDLNIFVDYAHTPDALIKAIRALRESGFKKVIAVFGCGGDRDRSKRPLMARAVAENADAAILTSDNPRFEDPLAIINDALPGLENARERLIEPDRRKATAAGIAMLDSDSALLIAGKGHEDYQLIRGVKHHYSDQETALELVLCG